MKKILLLLLLTNCVFAQKNLHFDTFLHYEQQKDSLRHQVIYLTSTRFPNHSAQIWDTEKDSSNILVFEYDQLISSSFIKVKDFLQAENITLKSSINSDVETKDYQFKHKHYQFESISQHPKVVFEFVPTLSKSMIKKKKINKAQIELLPNSENEMMFCDGSVLKWLMSQQSDDYQGIPSKITYFNPENGTVTSSLLLVEKIDVSKNIILEKTTPKIKIVK